MKENIYEVIIDWIASGQIDKNTQTIFISADNYYEAASCLFELYNFDAASDIKIRRIA